MSNQSVDSLVETLSNLSVLEMAKLKAALEDKWGVKAAAAGPVMMAAPVAAQGAATAAQESTEFKVTLESAPADKKIAVIKVVREVTGLGLAEAKGVVEGAPKVLKETTTKADAAEIEKKLKDAGATVSVKGL